MLLSAFIDCFFKNFCINFQQSIVEIKNSFLFNKKKKLYSETFEKWFSILKIKIYRYPVHKLGIYNDNN